MWVPQVLLYSQLRWPDGSDVIGANMWLRDIEKYIIRDYLCHGKSIYKWMMTWGYPHDLGKLHMLVLNGFETDSVITLNNT